jgi:hypothetical protein
MTKYQFNSQEVCIFPKEGGIISVIRYYYTRKNHSEPKLTSESNWRWETNCKEFGTLTHKNYTNHAKDYIKQGF